jgi:hypothetical protein
MFPHDLSVPFDSSHQRSSFYRSLPVAMSRVACFGVSEVKTGADFTRWSEGKIRLVRRRETEDLPGEPCINESCGLSLVDRAVSRSNVSAAVPARSSSLSWMPDSGAEVTEIKSVPCVPLSHPFVERLIGTIRRECLDHTLFWTTVDLENKLLEFRNYFNHHRTHTSREGQTPDTPASRPVANLRSFRRQPHCRGIYQTPVQTDVSKTRARCGIRSTSAKPRNEIIWCLSS